MDCREETGLDRKGFLLERKLKRGKLVRQTIALH